MSSDVTKNNIYEITDSTVEKSKSWQSTFMYKTSYLNQSEKNPAALKNSTQQLLNTRSSGLKAISSRENFLKKPVENTDFINYDLENHFRTSYNDMSEKSSKLINTHFIPNYQGYVPGIKSENSFGKSFTHLTKENLTRFNDRRFCTLGYDHEKLWQYNPVSITNVNFNQRGEDRYLKKSLFNHEFTTKIKDSGYDCNHNTFDRTGWKPHHSLNSDMTRTEYGIQFNPKKEIHFKEPLYSTGQLKKRQLNYKHT